MTSSRRNLFLLAILSVWCSVNGLDMTPCSRRVYVARAEQLDLNGLKCWDLVKVPSCGGRCNSREVSDWMFPFKKSHHPVCVYGNRKSLMVKLRHCDDGVAPGTNLFHFVAPENCRCKVCSSRHTSCEWLPPNSNFTINADDEDILNQFY